MALAHTSASTKEHYISSSKTYDGIDCKKFNEWLEGVHRLSKVTGKAPLDVAVATSSGSLHKYICELIGKKDPWEIIEGKIQESFSEFGSPVVAQSKRSNFTQSAMTMHEYISEFTRLVGHAYKIKPTDIGSHLLATQFIQGIPSLHIKNKLRFLMSKNEIRTLSDLFASALQEDQKQKIREIDFGTQDSQCEVHAIKDRGCYECGQEDHLVKDCPNRKSNNTHNDRSHHTYKNQKTQEENSIEQSLQSLTNLVKTLIKQNSQPHISYQKPTFRYNNTKYQNNQNRPHNRDRNRGYHKKGKYKNNIRINELGEYQSDNSSCSDQSEGEDEFDQHEPLTSDESKKLGYPSQENGSLPDPLRGNNVNSDNSRQHPSSTNDDNDDVHSPMNTHKPIVNSPVNNNIEETDIVHLGRKPQDECSLFIETGKRKFKALWDSGAGQCVLSFDCYNAIPARYKSDLFPSLIKIRAANGTIIDNKGEM